MSKKLKEPLLKQIPDGMPVYKLTKCCKATMYSEEKDKDGWDIVKCRGCGEVV